MGLHAGVDYDAERGSPARTAAAAATPRPRCSSSSPTDTRRVQHRSPWAPCGDTPAVHSHWQLRVSTRGAVADLQRGAVMVPAHAEEAAAPAAGDGFGAKRAFVAHITNQNSRGLRCTRHQPEQHAFGHPRSWPCRDTACSSRRQPFMSPTTSTRCGSCDASTVTTATVGSRSASDLSCASPVGSAFRLF